MANVAIEHMPLLTDFTLWDSHDSIDIGLFLLNDDGYVVRYNCTAGRILGIDSNSVWDDVHIGRIDSILSTGLAERLEHVLNNSYSFTCRNVRCTNNKGIFLNVSLSCRLVSGNNGDEKYVIGVIRDAGNEIHENQHVAGKSQELHVLSTVASALSSSYGLEPILKVILTGATASQGLGFNRAFLFMYDEQVNSLNGHLAIGPSSAEEAGYIWQKLDSSKLSLDELLDSKKKQTTEKSDAVNSLIRDLKLDLNHESLISRACHTGTWMNFENVLDMDSSTAYFLDRLGTKRAALVPMVSKGKLMGLLAADNLITGRPICDNSVELLQILANQAAVAMERARLYEEQVERASEMERLNGLLAESQDHIIKIEKMSVIGELTAAIAHELRNPLTVIGGFANLTLKSSTSDEQREYLGIIANETLRCESVLNHVLDFSKASKGESKVIDVSNLIRKNLDLLRGRLRRPDLDISLSLADETMSVFGNYDQLSHAFYQFFKLVAEEFVPPGKAEVRTEPRNGSVVVTIKVKVKDADVDRTVKALKQVITDNKASQRLTMLVAEETIRYHGGNCGLSFAGDGMPSLYIELPLSKEVHDVASNPYSR